MGFLDYYSVVLVFFWYWIVFFFCFGDLELVGDVFLGGVLFVNIILILICFFIFGGDFRSRKIIFSILYILLLNYEGVESYYVIKISYRDM